jgi:hypothetical protein
MIQLNRAIAVLEKLWAKDENRPSLHDGDL